MVLAGSIAATALPMSASATFGGTITIVGNGPDPIATIDPIEITSDGFSSGYLSEHPDYLNANNLWAVSSSYNIEGVKSGFVFATVSGNNLAGKLNEYKEESDTTYYYTDIKYSHKYVVTTDDPTTTSINTNNAQTNAQTATTFPVNVSSPDPLASIKGYTVWYGVLSGSSVISSDVVPAGDKTTLSTPADSISIEMSTFQDLYTSSADDDDRLNRFFNGITLIQVDTAYNTFEIPVYDGLGKLTTDKLSVTDGDNEGLIPDGKTEALKGVYKLVYDKDSSTQKVSAAFTNKADLWNAIGEVADTYGEFDVSKAKLVRYVHYDAVIGYFTSVDLLNEVADNQDINYLNERKNSGSIWTMRCEVKGPNGYDIYPNKFVYGDSFDAEIKEFLNEHNCDTVDLSNKTQLHITATDPSKQVNPYGGFKLEITEYVKQYITIDTDKQYPVKVSDLAAKLTAEISPTAGMKYNKDEWELWPCYTSTGNITMEKKATVADPTEDIGITHYELALEQHRGDLLVYFKQVAIAPAVTVTDPAVGDSPVTTATVPENDGYSVVADSVKWYDGSTELTAADQFAAGRKYTVKVTLAPDTGLAFIDTTPVTINGETPTVKTLNQDGTLTVSYTFDALPLTEITSVALNVTAPALGKTPNTTATTVPASANYTVSAVTWSPADAQFKAGEAYTASAVVTAKDGYNFTANTAAKINGKTATVVLNNDGTLTVSYTFDALPLTEITSVALNVTAPALGKTPNTTATTVPASANYTVSAVTWSPADAQFKAGEAYTASAVVTAKDGYNFTANTAAKINGKTATVVLNNDGTLTVSYTFSKLSSGGGYIPTRPVTPPAEPLPSIDGKARSWNQMADYITKTVSNTFVIDLNGLTEVPENVIKAIADRDSKVTILVDGTFSWVVDGADITSPVKSSFAVKKTDSVKSDGLRGSVGTKFSASSAGIPARLQISFKALHAGKFANLYKNENGKLNFVGCAKIGTDGSVLLPGTNGECVVMICEFSDLLGDMNNDGVLSAADASAILMQIIGLSQGNNSDAADMNGDGKINAADASEILKRIIGLA